MRKLILALPLALAVSAPTIGNDVDTQSLTEKQQMILASSLSGRTAGDPQDCISRRDTVQMRSIGDNILVFSSRRNAHTIYVNRPAGGCPGADHNSLTINKLGSSRTCHGDVAIVTDQVSGVSTGSCALSEFVPYVRDKG